MTYFAGDERQHCNQCGYPLTSYYKHTDEYLCEECEAYALKMVAEEEEREFEDEII